MKTKLFGAKEFRSELENLLPGYKWTVHKARPYLPDVMEATGTRSSGLNRLSTICVVRSSSPWYTVRSAGYGTRGPWVGESSNKSLASAVRDLQKHYKVLSDKYSSLAQSIERGRKRADLPGFRA